MATFTEIKKALLQSNERAVLISASDLQKNLSMSKHTLETFLIDIPFTLVGEKGNKRLYFVDDIARAVAESQRFKT